MTDKKFAYVLLKYPFYEGSTILMVSSSHDEIILNFTREFRKLDRGYGLQVKQYEFGKLYSTIIESGKTIRHIEKEYDGNIKDFDKIIGR